MLDVNFHERGVMFAAYPFRAATVYPSGMLTWPEVASVDPTCAPPEIRARSGEILFVSATRRDELSEWACRSGVPIVSRIDVWGLLLEPFLDTEHSATDRERVMRTLDGCGIAGEEVERIRSQVHGSMTVYNFGSGLWDWCHLGLFDLLSALSGELTGERHRLPDEAFARFYWFAMEIAGRARPIS